MKKSSISTIIVAVIAGFLFLFVWTSVPTYAQEEKHEQDARPEKQEQQQDKGRQEQQEQSKDQQQEKVQQEHQQQTKEQQQEKGQQEHQQQADQQEKQQQTQGLQKEQQKAQVQQKKQPQQKAKALKSSKPSSLQNPCNMLRKLNRGACGSNIAHRTGKPSTKLGSNVAAITVIAFLKTVTMAILAGTTFSVSTASPCKFMADFPGFSTMDIGFACLTRGRNPGRKAGTKTMMFMSSIQMTVTICITEVILESG